MNYSLLTDFEINKLVAQRMGYPITEKQPFGEKGQSPVRLAPGYGGYFDPCNDPSHGWRILVENSISIGYDGISWSAYCVRTDAKYNDWRNYPEHPMRLAMIVFLMGG